MNLLEICFSPELVHLHDLRGKAVVVVDIFRATSTMVTALANGVRSIRPVEDLETCRALGHAGYLTAGERNGQKTEGFHLGNSPLSYLNRAFEGQRVAMTTTNGTVAIERSKTDADEVLIGAFLNLQATASYLIELKKPVLILCAGWKGKFNLEDSLYAGALASLLRFPYDCDGTLAMEALYQHVQDDLSGFLKKASHAKRLQNYEIEADIDFCLTLNKYPLVAKLIGEEIGIKKTLTAN
ncbi:MAG: 2-phosphosulfolactate phosphatase [Lunatimonas sp.]|uniref:2-phosphosulfolactate phosphatase n=1 Tax=Lunatimonas sp. TaxID=2060141 RepID=UPI00263B332C|nr:2-phosphosulfolactate phosphatase [Lunatimonas sp.]MCC5939115.1 2-phosphosulfolactate phosphatase [Lunatimonas sp.]